MPVRLDLLHSNINSQGKNWFQASSNSYKNLPGDAVPCHADHYRGKTPFFVLGAVWYDDIYR